MNIKYSNISQVQLATSGLCSCFKWDKCQLSYTAATFRCPQTFGIFAFVYFNSLRRISIFFLFSALSVFYPHIFSCLSFLSSDTFCLPSLFCQDTHTHTQSGGEVERLVLACHLSSALTLALITAPPLANAASLGRRSMCSRHKRRREFAPGNVSSSHYGIRKSVWCDRQFTPAAKRSFCFSPSL